MRQPIAVDLRVILTVLKVSSNLERIGDYAKNMAKRTTVLAGMQQVNGSPASIRRMAKEVELMLKDVLDAYIQRDADLALIREFLTCMMEDPRNITACMHLHFIAKNTERMGEHVTNIAEQVIYLVTGETPDDKRPKEDQTSIDADIAPS